MPVVNPGIRRYIGSAIQRLFNSASFSAPLTHSLTLERGTGSPTFTRATTGTFQDNEGVLRTAIAGEARFTGARRVENLIRLGAAQSSTLAIGASVTMTLPAGTYIFSQGVSVGTATFSGTGGATGTLAASASVRTSVVKTITAGTLIVTGSVAILTDIQVENITGRTDQTTPSEYVSVGVLSAPYHGAGVDGVEFFDTDLDGNPLTTLETLLAEPAATNLLLQSAVVATQSISVTAAAHTLSFKGTGTITLSGASTAGPLVGTGANDRVTLTFTPSAGSLTLTVSGSCTIGQLELGSAATSYIATTTVAVARNADVLTYTGGDIPNLKTLAATFQRAVGVSDVSVPLRLSDGTGNNANGVNLTSATGVQFAGVTGGDIQWNPAASNTYTPGTVAKAAWAFATNDIKMDFNGTAQTPDTVATPAVVTQLNVGHGSGSFQLNGNVGGIYGWTRNLSQSELGAIDR